MKKLLAAVVSAAVLTSPLVVADAAHAKKRNPGCITKAEFRTIKKGQTPRRVAKIVGSKGKVSPIYSDATYKSQLREFRACRPFRKNSTVFVMLETSNGPLRVFQKSGSWARN